MRARRRQGHIILFAFLVLSITGPLFSEEPSTETAQLAKSNNGEEMLNIFDEAVGQLKTYDDYEKFFAGIKEMILAREGSSTADFLYYIAAEARLRQLEFLAGQNDVVSGRVYMSVNDRYYAEALEYLDKALGVTKSKKLTDDIYFRKFLIYREKFQAEKADEAFNGLVSALGAFGPGAKEELARIAAKFTAKDSSADALRLRLAYASKADPEMARRVMEDIKKEADAAFEHGNMKVAAVMYERYIKEGAAYFPSRTFAPKVMEIAEKYLDAQRYRDARKYYELYKAAFPASNFKDYCDYRIGLCLYEEKDIPKATAQLEAFLENYKNSVWFDKAFITLAGIYYAGYTDDKAMAGLGGLIDKYYRKNTGDYARILEAMIYYGQKKYDKALAELKKVEPSSVYAYSAEMITGDIAAIKKGASPSFSAASRDTYRAWEIYPMIAVNVSAFENDKKIEPVVQDGAFLIDVKALSSVRFEIEGIEDLDRFSEYLQDKEDASRLPKKLREEKEKDILSIEWSAEGGTFTGEKQSRSKTWQSPAEPGTYKVTLRVDDFGLVRPPDKGSRKDAAKEIIFFVTVKERFYAQT